MRPKEKHFGLLGRFPLELRHHSRRHSTPHQEPRISTTRSIFHGFRLFFLVYRESRDGKPIHFLDLLQLSNPNLLFSGNQLSVFDAYHCPFTPSSLRFPEAHSPGFLSLYLTPKSYFYFLVPWIFDATIGSSPCIIQLLLIDNLNFSIFASSVRFPLWLPEKLRSYLKV